MPSPKSPSSRARSSSRTRCASEPDPSIDGGASLAEQLVNRIIKPLGESFPVLGYDELTAAQVQIRLDGLSPAELRKVRDYERRHANRKTVLAAIDKNLAEA